MAAPQIRRFDRADFDAIRPTLLEVYAEVYADQLHLPFESLESFEGRLMSHASRPGWEAVVGYDGDKPVGYTYAAPLPSQARWWTHMLQPLSEEFTAEDGTRTLALFELMLRKPWRGNGVAKALHDDFLAGRSEERVTLLVEPEHPKVVSLYESWGYASVGDQRPFPDAPVLKTMVRQLREPVRP